MEYKMTLKTAKRLAMKAEHKRLARGRFIYFYGGLTPEQKFLKNIDGLMLMADWVIVEYNGMRHYRWPWNDLSNGTYGWHPWKRRSTYRRIT